MRNNFMICVVVSTLLLQMPAHAQIVPELGSALQSVTERQAERAQQQAAERALQQIEAVQNRVVDRTTEQQAEAVQGQTVERIADQVERAQAQATERAQSQATERAQAQLEQVQGQLGRAQRETQRAQDQVQRTRDQLQRVQERSGGSDINPGLGGVLAQAAQASREAGAQTPVTDIEGNTVFVEITLPQGERAVAYEWVMLVTAAQRQQLELEAPRLLTYLSSSQDFSLTAGEMLTFAVPPDLDANDVILQLVPENLRGQIDRNHIFSPRSKDDAPSASMPLSSLLPAVCQTPVALGIIDSHIDLGHPAFQRLQQSPNPIVSKNFVEGKLEQADAHGTAVAALLVGEHSEEGTQVLSPLLPNARLYAASVFHKGDTIQEGASVLRVLAALDWLAQQDDVRVINMSLAGPPNKLLEQTIAELSARDKVVVAAAGNDGPHGPARYPAAYEQVVAVAAADRNGSIYRWSNQGPYVDFTALGVDVVTAAADHGYEAQSGTSFAAPVVSAFVACNIAGSTTREQALRALDELAIDLGEPGIDPVYGAGLLHP
jgi:subtilisin family serine protease